MTYKKFCLVILQASKHVTITLSNIFAPEADHNWKYGRHSQMQELEDEICRKDKAKSVF